jgi:hypothetical protein
LTRYTNKKLPEGSPLFGKEGQGRFSEEHVFLIMAPFPGKFTDLAERFKKR